MDVAGNATNTIINGGTQILIIMVLPRAPISTAEHKI